MDSSLYPPNHRDNGDHPNALSSRKYQRRLKRHTPYKRREQCRINQARYRERQREYEESIKLGIDRLKDNIRDLEVEQRVILSGSSVTRNVWAVATEYFYLFQNACMTNPSVVATQQVAILKKNMASDVTDGIAVGVEAIVENWKLLSFYHDEVQIRLQRMEQITQDSLLAFAMIRLTITKKTLQYLYPHLIDNNDKGTAALAAKLLNQHLLVRGSVRFDWDSVNERVVRLESKFDILSPMLKLVGSLENVVRVFEEALVTPEGRFLLIDKIK